MCFCRRNVVVFDAVMELRTALDNLMKNVKGLTSDEKGFNYYFMLHLFKYVLWIADPEEFLNLLFKHVLFVDPFLCIRFVNEI